MIRTDRRPRVAARAPRGRARRRPLLPRRPLTAAPPTSPGTCPAPSSSTSTRSSPRTAPTRRSAAIRSRTPEAFAADMAALGIGDDDVVVAYDDEGGVMAARLVWMLRATGHEAALLDGGIQAWDGPLETETPPRPPASFSARGRSRASPRSTTPPTRQRRRRRAPARALPRRAATPLDVRFGHIPGARSLPAARTCPRTATCSRPTRCGRKLGAGRDRRRGARRVLLRLRRHRLPQPARDRARRPRHRPPVPRLLVAVEPGSGAAGRDRLISRDTDRPIAVTRSIKQMPAKSSREFCSETTRSR